MSYPSGPPRPSGPPHPSGPSHTSGPRQPAGPPVPEYGTPGRAAPYGTDPYGDRSPAAPPADLFAPPVHDTVLRADAPHAPHDPYGPPAPAPRRRRRASDVLLLTLAGVGVLVFAVCVVLLLVGRDDAPPAAQEATASATPDPAPSGSPAATPDPAETTTDDETASDDPTGDESTDEDAPWLDARYRAGAETDPVDGPALAPMSWEFFSDNDWTVNGDRIALTARRDFACDDLPDVPALAVGVADVCQGGFEARVVSHDGPAVGLDAVVVEVGSEEAAERVVAAYDAAGSGHPLADTSGPAHPTLAAAVPQPGFETTTEILDSGQGPAIMLPTGSVVVLLRLGVDDALGREQVLPVARATGFVVADHEAAQLFGG
ncbi:hypothetical protein [Cellulosimicrobium marinum]|uniref:hypothetical protein n=1 Tax=Cellulosimicrobium marinum TaxID=1638992 RepID=UPI001E5D9A7B|nr:hypothetical protein [Cellulosimicrobium marinum]MCB7135556.1 hypothetical protein [Cellulosimicrobium marinum]